jgi:hypothetical protein
MTFRWTTTLLLCLAALAALPAAASASSGQVAVFEDNGKLAQSGATARDATLSELQGLGVDVIKFQLPWADIAPRTATKPAAAATPRPIRAGSLSTPCLPPPAPAASA